MPNAFSNSDPGVEKPKGFKRALGIGFVSACFVAVILVFCPNYYCSEVRILPSDSKGSGGLGQLAAAAAAMGVGVSATESEDANFMDILDSRTVKEDLLKTEFQFRMRPWRFGAMQVRRQTLYEYIKAKNMDQAVRAFGDYVFASRDIKSKVITIKVETKSPELSQQMAEKLVVELESFVVQKGRTKGGEKARFAAARLKESREEMTKAEDAFRRFLEVNRSYAISPDPAVRLQGSRLEAELKLQEQIVVTLSVNLEQSLLQEKNDIPIVNVLDHANLPIDKSKPKRSLITLVTFFAIAAGSWSWLNRDWVKTRFFDDEEAPGATAGPR